MIDVSKDEREEWRRALVTNGSERMHDGFARRDVSRGERLLQNLERLPIERDFVFGDTGAAGQIVSMRRYGAGGYTGTATITLAA